MTGPAVAGGEPTRVLLRVVRGEPNDVELAALTVVVATAATAAPAQGSPAVGVRRTWNDLPAHLRTSLTPGVDAWRTSTRPR